MRFWNAPLAAVIFIFAVSTSFAGTAGLSTTGDTDYPNLGVKEVASKYFPGDHTPWTISVSAARDEAYLFPPSNDNDQILVLDTNTFQLKRRIPSDTTDTRWSVLSPNGSTIYQAITAGSSRLGRTNLDSNQYLGLIDTGLPSSVGYGALAIDPDDRFLYIGTTTTPGRVEILRNDTLTMETPITFATGLGSVQSMCVDSIGRYAYVSVAGSGSARFLKIDLAARKVLNTITPSNSGTFFLATVIDPNDEFVYFAQNSASTTSVIKVHAATFQQVASLTLPAGENRIGAAVIDQSGSNLLLTTLQETLKIVRINLNTFTRTGAYAPALAGYNLGAIALMPSGDHIIVAAVPSLGNQLHVREISVATLSVTRTYIAEGKLDGAQFLKLDDGNRKLYTYGGSRGIVGKLDADSLQMTGATEEYWTTQGTDAFSLNNAKTQFYVGGFGSEYVRRHNVSDMGFVSQVYTGYYFTEGSAQTLNMDPAGAFVYSGQYVAKIKKIQISDMTVTTALNLTSFGQLTSSALDSAANYIYYGSGASPARLARVNLSPFATAGTLTLETGENAILNVQLDPAGGYAYLGLGTSPGKVVRVDTNTFTRVDALTLEPGEDKVNSIAIDPVDRVAYLVTETRTPAKVVRMNLDTMTREGVIDLRETNWFWGAAWDPTKSRALVVGGNSLVALADGLDDLIHGTRLELTDYARLSQMKFYSHQADGNLRLSLYDDSPARRLLWSSGTIANSVAAGEITVPIASGSPSEVVLAPGTYWLAWQTDSSASIASHTTGAPGDGFQFVHEFGVEPATISVGDTNSNSSRWTQYVEYDIAPGLAAFSVANATHTSTTLNLVHFLAEGDPATSIELSEDGTFASFISISLPATPTVDLSTGDGPKTVYARLRNAAGVGNVRSHAIILDTVSPTATITSSVPSHTNQAFNATVFFGEDIVSFTADDLTVSNATISNFDGILNGPYTFTVTPLSDGPVTVQVGAAAARDKAGNPNLASAALSTTYDATPPVPTIASPVGVYTGGGFSASVTFDEAVTGFSAASISTVNATIGSVSGSLAGPYTFNVTPVAEGTVSLQVNAAAVTDIAGNPSVASNALSTTADFTAPQPVLSSGVGPHSNAPFAVTVNFGEEIAAFTLGDLSATGPTLQNLQDLGNGQFTFDVVPVNEGTFELSVAAGAVQDLAGNDNLASNVISTLVDYTAPEVAMVADITQAGATFSADFVSTDTLSGVATVALYMRGPGEPTFAATPHTSASSSGNFQVTTLADGLHELAIVATDHAGNSSPLPTAHQIAILVNDIENSIFPHTVTTDGTYYFPMTNDIDIVLEINAFTGSETIEVSRILNPAAPAGLGADRLINEMLTITGNLGGGEATLIWNFEPDSASTLVGEIDAVYKVVAGEVVQQYPVPAGANPIVLTGITSFSEWHAGSSSAAVLDWNLLDH